MDDERTAEGHNGEVVSLPESTSGLVKVLVQALLSPAASNVLIEVAGELLAEHARFDRWFLEHIKGRASDAALMELLDISDEVNVAVAQSWEACLAQPNGGREWIHLETTIRSAFSQLSDARARVWKHV